jgi:hypothetical protein
LTALLVVSLKPPNVFQYVALSYVWGQPLANDVDSAGCLAQKDDKLPLNIPRTIRDAMTITDGLGFQYLWVDKYCIDQSLPPHGFDEQVAAMDLIYSGAAITIIAAAGNDSNYGLPGVSHRPRTVHSITIDGSI